MLIGITKFLIHRLFSVKIEGTYEGGEANGLDKTLLVSNHNSFLDGIFLMFFLPENPVFVIHKDSTRSRFFRLFLRHVDYVAVDSLHPMPVRKVIRQINNGRPVVIFPEGRSRISGRVTNFYSGAAFIALKTGATIIPIHVSGVKFSYLTRIGKILSLRLFPTIRVNIFPPKTLPVNTDLERDKQLNLAREDIHRLMMDMTVESRKSMTLFKMLLESRNQYGKNRIMFRDTLSDNVSYGDAVTKSVSLSILLQRKVDLSPRVGILLPNSNACGLAFYAMQHAGHTPVMINYTAGARAINAGLLATEVKTILTSRRFIKKGELQPLIDEMIGYDIIYLEDLRKTVSLADKLAIAAKRNFPEMTAAKQKIDDEALVLFTSGTEGLPKGVVHTHDSLTTQIAQINTIYDFDEQDSFMVCLPVFHVFGLMAGFALPVSTGSMSFLYPNPLHYKTIPELIYENSCTVIFSTSTFLAGYARYAESYDMHSLRYVIAGAEKLSPEIANVYYEKFGVRVMEGYGATEAAPVISAETTRAHKRGTVGRWIPGLIAELEPVAGIEKGGKVIIHADNVMMGYLRAENPGVIERSPIGKYGKRTYDTGDIAYVDDKGLVYLQGRVKRFAKIAGEMISLSTVEQMTIHASPECFHAAIMLTDSKKGEMIHLFTTDPNLAKKQLQNASKELGIPKLAVPKSIQVVDEIPMFASGKINYFALTELVEEETSVATNLISHIKDIKETVNKEIHDFQNRDKGNKEDKEHDKGDKSDKANKNDKKEAVETESALAEQKFLVEKISTENIPDAANTLDGSAKSKDVKNAKKEEKQEEIKQDIPEKKED